VCHKFISDVLVHLDKMAFYGGGNWRADQQQKEERKRKGIKKQYSESERKRPNKAVPDWRKPWKKKTKTPEKKRMDEKGRIYRTKTKS